MLRRLRALRLVIVLGYVAVGLGVALHLIGAYALIGLPLAVLLLEPVFDWVVDGRTTRRMTVEIRGAGRDALTSEQIGWSFTTGRGYRILDEDPEWGRLAEGLDQIWNQPITAVEVINSTAEPDGTFKKIWLRVPSRGDRQGTRLCEACKRDIAWPPRTAKEAIAWTFRLCVDHYGPAQAT